MTGVDRRWRRGPTVLHRRTADGPLVLPPGGDDPTMLAGAAAAVWLLLDEPLSESTLAARLADATTDDRIETLPAEPAWRAADVLGDVLPALAAARIIEAAP